MPLSSLESLSESLFKLLTTVALTTSESLATSLEFLGHLILACWAAAAARVAYWRFGW